MSRERSNEVTQVMERTMKIEVTGVTERGEECLLSVCSSRWWWWWWWWCKHGRSGGGSGDTWSSDTDNHFTTEALPTYWATDKSQCSNNKIQQTNTVL